MLGCKHKTLLLIHIDPPGFFPNKRFNMFQPFLAQVVRPQIGRATVCKSSNKHQERVNGMASSSKTITVPKVP